jgi:tRNA(Ile2) C34 agmatinyltransferase TiaS
MRLVKCPVCNCNMKSLGSVKGYSLYWCDYCEEVVKFKLKD